MRTHRIRTAIVAAVPAAVARSPIEPSITDMWTVPTIAPDQLTLIVAYSFGNRIPRVHRG
ncbi:hypothetical protein [Nocardia terpenica]|uniref:Uncharacterized protein n=1 Tax=Nocardia terpenica TaxID=455432 RepID=A0A6G9Z6W4_9NOCA|nr:hypothetical protein [Nocardia terpenica]QIS21339.1 hypothetical protein F6W96_26420 [Nocardia terpenica]